MSVEGFDFVDDESMRQVKTLFAETERVLVGVLN